MIQHTPGPWRQGRYSNGHGGQDGPIRIWGPAGEVLADVPLDGEANARLIAAAPRMHEAIYQAACRLDDAANFIAEEVSEAAAQQWYDAATELRILLDATSPTSVPQPPG
jgi:hypothetical protein